MSTWFGWDYEPDLGNADDRFGVHYLTIADDDGEELAVIIHRTDSADAPTDRGAKDKEALAQRIVDALNASGGVNA